MSSNENGIIINNEKLISVRIRYTERKKYELQRQQDSATLNNGLEIIFSFEDFRLLLL